MTTQAPARNSPPSTLAFTTGEADARERLDKVLVAYATAMNPDLSRTRLQGLVRDGHVTVDGKAALDVKLKLRAGQAIEIVLPPPVDAEPLGEDIKLTVVYEDDALIVIDKPAGLVVHPAAGHETGTLVNALIAHCGESLSGIGGVRRPGIVHRLDKDTTGLMVVAKTDRAHQHLAAQFADHGREGPLERSYMAIVWGDPSRTLTMVDAPIDRDPRHREKMAVVAESRRVTKEGEAVGRHAVTHTQKLESYPPGSADPVASLVRCTLETGRTHQIRVHMTHAGFPLLGDPLYGAGFKTKASQLSDEAQAALATLNRQALHAAVLGFEHPVTGETLSFESALPPDMAALQAALKRG